MKPDPYAELIKNYVKTSKDEKKSIVPPKIEPAMIPQQMPPMQHNFGPSKASVDRACQMKEEMLQRLEKLAQNLPANTLDQLIDELGGPENVSEMTGRKGRVVQVKTSTFELMFIWDLKPFVICEPVFSRDNSSLL